ncbi:MAG TPA: transglutaminase domain-containing protein [Flavobacterium sp.]
MRFPKFIILSFLFLIFGSAYSQDYSAVDTKVKSYPIFAKPELLANKINADFNTEDDKARAIFTWIASNIKYDMVEYMGTGGVKQVAFTYRTPEEKARKVKQFNMEIVSKTWRTRKAICHGYAELFNHLAELTGLESKMIPGTSKSHPTQIGKFPSVADHAWNAVKTNGKWHLIDATWAAGGVDGATNKFFEKFNDSYFFTDPEIFFLNHFPEDDKNLMSNKTREEFAALPLYYGDYLESDFTIEAPNKGIITAKSANVPFRFKNLSADRISYVLSNNNVFKGVIPVRNGDISEFDIFLDKNFSGYLTIFVDGSSVVSYKIQRG